MQELVFFIEYIIGFVLVIALACVGVGVYQWFERLFDNACGGTLDLFESQWGAL